MKTVQEIYKDLISSERGHILFQTTKEYCINGILAASDFSRETTVKTFDKLVALLASEKPYPRSNTIIASYFAINQDGSEILCLPAVDQTSLMQQFRHIEEWDALLDMEGDTAFREMESEEVKKLLMHKHRLFPITLMWNKANLVDILGSYIYIPDNVSEYFLFEELMLTILFVMCANIDFDDGPEYLSEFPAIGNEDRVAKSMLMSYINFYDSLNKARIELCKKLDVKEIILRNSAKCKRCKDHLISTHRHDAVTCSCKALTLDGGQDYMRRVYDDRDCFEDTSIIEYIE